MVVTLGQPYNVGEKPTVGPYSVLSFRETVTRNVALQIIFELPSHAFAPRRKFATVLYLVHYKYSCLDNWCLGLSCCQELENRTLE